MIEVLLNLESEELISSRGDSILLLNDLEEVVGSKVFVDHVPDGEGAIH